MFSLPLDDAKSFLASSMVSLLIWVANFRFFMSCWKLGFVIFLFVSEMLFFDCVLCVSVCWRSASWKSFSIVTGTDKQNTEQEIERSENLTDQDAQRSQQLSQGWCRHLTSCYLWTLLGPLRPQDSCLGYPFFAVARTITIFIIESTIKTFHRQVVWSGIL